MTLKNHSWENTEYSENEYWALDEACVQLHIETDDDSNNRWNEIDNLARRLLSNKE